MSAHKKASVHVPGLIHPFPPYTLVISHFARAYLAPEFEAFLAILLSTRIALLGNIRQQVCIVLVLILDRVLIVVCSADNVRASAEDSTSADVSYEDSTTSAAGLSELLDVSVPSQLDVSAQLRDVLLLLRLLEALNR